MSRPRYAALPPDAINDKRLIATDLDVLNDLGLHADTRTGWCYRAQKVLADAIGASRRTVQRSLDRLVELGYLEREARIERGGQGQKSNLYRILFDTTARRGQLDLFEDAPPEPRKRGGGARGSNVVTHPPRHGRGVNGAPPASRAGGKWRTIERPLMNDGCAAPRARPANDDRPTLDLTEAGAVPLRRPARPPPSAAGEAGAVLPLASPAHLWSRAETDRLLGRLREAGGAGLCPISPGLLSLAEPIGWIAGGCDLDFDVLPTVAGLAARARGSPIRSWSYFASAVREARDRRLAALTPTGLPAGATREEIGHDGQDGGRNERAGRNRRSGSGGTRAGADGRRFSDEIEDAFADVFPGVYGDDAGR